MAKQPPKNSLRVRSAAEYRIEVNDQGDEIVFDMTDTSLASKMQKMFEEVDRLNAEFEIRAKEIENRPDEPYSTVKVKDPETGVESDRVILTRNQYDGAQLVDELYQRSRLALDMFMGAGACMKIFGEKNYEGMFVDLIEQLKPHFEAMGLNMAELKHTGASKYKPNREQRRAIK